MAGPQIQLNRIPNDPSLKDLLDTLKKDIMLSLNSHHLATVQSFNATDLTLVATINYSKTYFTKNPKTLEYVPFLVPYPTLTDVPYLMIGGGGAGLNIPIKQGDQCLILFNDRDIDNWFAGATTGPVATPRLHSLADGLALVFLQDFTGYDATKLLLTNGNASVGINPTTNKATIFNQTFNYSVLFQNLLTQLASLATATGNTGIATAITTLATEFAQLLE